MNFVYVLAVLYGSFEFAYVNLMNFWQFQVENIAILNPDQHVGIQEFVHTKKDHLVLDVRPELEFKMCNIPGTINFPYSKIERQEDVNYLRHMFDESVLEGVDNGIANIQIQILHCFLLFFFQCMFYAEEEMIPNEQLLL